ncbi:MAG: hypothetical protein R3E48_15885 [Burkholderiaceae bacterium]
MLLNAAIITAVVAVALLLLHPRLSGAVLWRAVVTPLASIIGSGFLVIGPTLDFSFGRYAPLAMAALCLVAYLFGAAVRFNIAEIDSAQHLRSRLEQRLDRLAAWALGFAYIVSVAYYLNLFGAFGLSLGGARGDADAARLLTTGVFVVILVVGWTRGFELLEQLEYLAVSAKLAIIAGLLVGLIAYFGERAANGLLVIAPAARTGWDAMALTAGLLVTVQGFETSRYLGATYDAGTRIRSMRLAQWVSSAIYLVYIALTALVFGRGHEALSETAIIDMMSVVAPILPALLVAAALSAQFSAAIADTGGSGGLFTELSGNRIRPRHAYAMLVALGLVLTWRANVFEIIAYASRAFALYYALQAAIAAIAAWRSRRLARVALFGAAALLGMAIAVFGEAIAA